MNAQEAIKRIEKFRNCNEEYNGEVHEALSIVLESAKLLHQEILEPSQQTEWRRKGDKRLVILYDIGEDGIEITDAELNKIGIREGE